MSEKPFIKLEDTEATVTDEDGNTRARMEWLPTDGATDPSGSAIDRFLSKIKP